MRVRLNLKFEFETANYLPSTNMILGLPRIFFKSLDDDVTPDMSLELFWIFFALKPLLNFNLSEKFIFAYANKNSLFKYENEKFQGYIEYKLWNNQFVNV